MKKKTTIALSAALLLSSATTAYAGIGVMIDNTPVNFTEATGCPVIDENGRTLVPLRATMEAYGCSVYWQSDAQKAYVAEGNFVIVVPLGEKYIDVMYEIVPIDTEAKMINDRVYLPIRAVLEGFGADVGWDQKSNSVTVKSAAKKAEELEKQLAYEEKQRQIAEINRQIDADIEAKNQQKILNEEKLRRDREEQLRKQQQQYDELMEELEEIAEEQEQLRKEAKEEQERRRKEAEAEAARRKQERIEESIEGSGGYLNSQMISEGYYNEGLTGGYGSTYADIAYQQYLDRLRAEGKIK